LLTLTGVLVRLPASAVAMGIVTGVVLYGGIVICLVLAKKRKP
jgi:hypothetical protein